jgi:hypothetical protein
MESKQTHFFCDKCEYTTSYKKDYSVHLLSKKHKLAVNSDTNNEVYNCECCSYQTPHKYNYNLHLLTKKHETNVLIANNKIQPNQCNNCNKIYSSQKNLWRHKKQCKKVADTIDLSEDDDDDDNENECSPDTHTQSQQEQTPPPGAFAITPELLLEVLKQNKELQNVLIEQNRNASAINTNIIGNTNNSHNSTVNKTFNIQFFLNEHCKNAIDIQQFVRMLDYSTANLEKNMKLGYTGGITKMITDGIQILPVEERPLHCSDEKREKIYIRDNGTWISGNESKERLLQVIADIANNNYNTFRRWVAENPTCQTLDTPAYQKFVTIYNGVIGSRSDEEEAKHVKKILSNIIDEITIEKEKYLR